MIGLVHNVDPVVATPPRIIARIGAILELVGPAVPAHEALADENRTMKFTTRLVMLEGIKLSDAQLPNAAVKPLAVCVDLVSGHPGTVSGNIHGVLFLGAVEYGFLHNNRLLARRSAVVILFRVLERGIIERERLQVLQPINSSDAKARMQG